MRSVDRRTRTHPRTIVGYQSWVTHPDRADRALSLRLAVAAVLTVVVLVPAALIGILVESRWDALYDVDEAVTRSVHTFAIGHHTWVVAMGWWSRAFEPNMLRVAAAVLAVWLWRWQHAPRLAGWVAITMTAGGVLGDVLKLLVGRHRPSLLEPVSRATGYSFPSGHALNSALAAAVFLLVLLPFTRRHPGRRALLWTVAVLVPLVTGLCRIGLGVHWASDVVGGWLLGVAVVVTTATVYEAWGVWSGRRRTDVAEEGVEPAPSSTDV